VLKYYAELSEPEIARALGVPRGTVKSRVFNGLARLRLALARLQLT
jgi:DNA-directed RNA polymerase specialized sigma24 family protein